MNTNYVLDASALVAFLNNERGADRVEQILKRGEAETCVITMHALNALEVYYGIYRAAGKPKAMGFRDLLKALPVALNDRIGDDIFEEAGRLKATYRVSIADAVALAEAKARNAVLVTADHHEFDSLEEQGEARFFWIR